MIDPLVMMAELVGMSRRRRAYEASPAGIREAQAREWGGGEFLLECARLDGASRARARLRPRNCPYVSAEHRKVWVNSYYNEKLEMKNET